MPRKILPITVSQKDNYAEYKRQYRKLRPEYEKNRVRKSEDTRRRALKRRYGITPEDYETILDKQKGRCAICYTNEPGRNGLYFLVDHCHKTKKVRGLLCDNCNKGLGHFRDNPNLLAKAIEYLSG